MPSGSQEAFNKWQHLLGITTPKAHPPGPSLHIRIYNFGVLDPQTLEQRTQLQMRAICSFITAHSGNVNVPISILVIKVRKEGIAPMC